MLAFSLLSFQFSPFSERLFPFSFRNVLIGIFPWSDFLSTLLLKGDLLGYLKKSLFRLLINILTTMNHLVRSVHISFRYIMDQWGGLLVLVSHPTLFASYVCSKQPVVLNCNLLSCEVQNEGYSRECCSPFPKPLYFSPPGLKVSSLRGTIFVWPHLRPEERISNFPSVKKATTC